jgi:hypothetical protein
MLPSAYATIRYRWRPRFAAGQDQERLEIAVPAFWPHSRTPDLAIAAMSGRSLRRRRRPGGRGVEFTPRTRRLTLHKPRPHAAAGCGDLEEET